MNMDASDLESFDKFVDKHWENQLNAKETVQVSAEVEAAPKRRGRKKRKNKSWNPNELSCFYCTNSKNAI